jgi:hypothetical protein
MSFGKNLFGRKGEKELLTKDTIAIKCKGCGRKYILGKDAIVATMARAMDEFISQGSPMLIFGDSSSLDDTERHPDAIVPVPRTRSWASLDPSDQLAQVTEMSRIKSSMSSGRTRWW